MTMKKVSLALVLAAGAAMQFAPLQTAAAADLGGYKDTPYVVMPWQGMYLGVNGGAAWGSSKVDDNFDYHGDPYMNGSAKSSSGLYGGQIGYNVQQGHAVFGLEGDIGYLGLKAQGDDKYCRYGDCRPDEHNISGKYETSGGLYGDITGRLGYATNRVLFYGKGGVAFLDANLKTHYDGYSFGNQVQNHNVPFDFDHSETMVGWTVGAGTEVAISPSWSIKAEYQHFDFGSMSNSYSDCKVVYTGGNCSKPQNGGVAALTGKTDTSVTADTVKFGLNYRINN
jgi:outer membrane immunogenic protein